MPKVFHIIPMRDVEHLKQAAETLNTVWTLLFQACMSREGLLCNYCLQFSLSQGQWETCVLTMTLLAFADPCRRRQSKGRAQWHPPT